jgi:predicted dehydrogenase
MLQIGASFDTLEGVRVDAPGHLYQGEVEDMADAILDGKAQRIALSDSRANVQVIQALVRSAAANLRVMITPQRP